MNDEKLGDILRLWRQQGEQKAPLLSEAQKRLSVIKASSERYISPEYESLVSGFRSIYAVTRNYPWINMGRTDIPGRGEGAIRILLSAYDNNFSMIDSYHDVSKAHAFMVTTEFWPDQPRRGQNNPDVLKLGSDIIAANVSQYDLVVFLLMMVQFKSPDEALIADVDFVESKIEEMIPNGLETYQWIIHAASNPELNPVIASQVLQ